VTNLLDSGAGSLPATVTAANAVSGANVINFAPTLHGTITLSGQLTITGNVSINGPGAGVLAVSGNNANRVFAIATGATASLSGLTIENGYVSVWNSPSGEMGAGIMNSGSLTVSNCTIAQNVVVGADLGFGAGIYNNDILTVRNSAIVNNTANGFDGGGWGGGIFNDMNPLPAPHSPPGYRLPSIVTISNSTIADNTADTGGGIVNYPGHTSSQTQMTISDSTIGGNTANWYGGGIRNGYALNLRNTIVAGNSAAISWPDLEGKLTSSGSNLIGNTTGGSGYAATDLLNVNPYLAPLQNNGGPTPTLALLPGSPAIDAGDPTQLGIADQRGIVRAGGVNIGAFQASASAFVLSAPSSGTGGIPFTLTVTAVDVFGQVAVGYRGTVQFSSSDASASLPSGYSFTQADNGMHVFTGLMLKTRGTQTITVTDTPVGEIVGGAAVQVM
jgi:hypothetical protein